MRRYLIASLVLTALVVSANVPNVAEARQPRYQRATNDTFFGRMMELERRKNAWLRETFLNR